MNDQENKKLELESQLTQVKQRLEVLDMIDERLFKMKSLAQRVQDENLSEDVIAELNAQMRDLEEQVKLLECENTPLY